MTKIKNTKKADKAISRLLRYEIHLSKEDAEELINEAFGLLDHPTPLKTLLKALDLYDQRVVKALAAEKPEGVTEYPRIEAMPTDDIFALLAQKVQDDSAGDLLDELERRYPAL